MKQRQQLVSYTMYYVLLQVQVEAATIFDGGGGCRGLVRAKGAFGDSRAWCRASPLVSLKPTCLEELAGSI